jgi:hypothetical protein
VCVCVCVCVCVRACVRTTSIDMMEVVPLYFTARSKFKAVTAGEIPFYTAPLSESFIRSVSYSGITWYSYAVKLF